MIFNLNYKNLYEKLKEINRANIVRMTELDIENMELKDRLEEKQEQENKKRDIKNNIDFKVITYNFCSKLLAKFPIFKIYNFDSIVLFDDKTIRMIEIDVIYQTIQCDEYSVKFLITKESEMLIGDDEFVISFGFGDPDSYDYKSNIIPLNEMENVFQVIKEEIEKRENNMCIE
jgi:hypothetical protein